MRSYFNDKALDGVCVTIGGIETFRRISKRFHRKVESDSTLNMLFPKNMAALEERLALYLVELTGGDPVYSGKRGKTSLICRHAHLAIGPTEAQLWLSHMQSAMEEEGLDNQNSIQLLSHLSKVTATLADPLIPLYRLPLAVLREKLEDEPALAHLNDHGRSLIRAAAIDWDVRRLRLLLEFGADVEMRDGGGHNALYRVANGSGNEDDGRAALELLLAHGVNVNQVTGVGKMTPLHMAARRGTVAIAEALLRVGANLEARDAKGETPLRRAVNCGKGDMVRLLIANGANTLSQDRSGRTVLEAARDERMRSILGRQ